MLSFFLIFSLFAKLTLATGEISLSLVPTEAILISGEVKVVTATITNNQNIPDTFTISIFPSLWLGTTTSFDKDRITLNPQSSGEIKISFGASECVEEFSNLFTVNVQSLSNNQIKASATEKITTERKFQICVSNVKFDKDFAHPGEAVTITVSIENPAASNSLPVKLITNVRSISGDILQTFQDNIETLQGRGTADISHSYTFGNFTQPGFYTFEVELLDSSNKIISQNSFRYRVGSVEKISQSKDISYGLLLQTVTIKVKNGGNEPVDNVIVKETVPSFLKLFFFPKDTPFSEASTDDKIVYSWLIPTILPGEERTVTYQIAVWNAVLVIIGVILLVLIVFRYVFTIRIVKSYKKFATVAGAKEIQIQLEVRNRTRHIHKEVVVRDVVPATAHVIEKFDTLRPTLRKLPGGTELLWKFDSLRPGEERVITYRIKPVMEIIGEILLPKASVRFVDHRKEVRRSISKSIEIKV